MSTPKKIGIALVALLVIIQFIQPSKNISLPLITDDDISKRYAISDDVHLILIKKCYDCHSNNTAYPWYYNIQPVAWWMAHHIEEGKDELNFSTFKTYPEKKANHKMEELSEAVNDGWMPLDSYLWMHHEAKITEEDRAAINAWLKTLSLPAEAEHH